MSGVATDNMSIMANFQPLTRCGCVVQGKAPDVARLLAEGLVEGERKGTVKKVAVKQLAEAFETFTTLASGTTVGGYLALSTAKPGWTSVFIDTEQPWLRWSMCLRLSKALDSLGLYYLYQPHTYRKEKGQEKGEMGAYQWVIADHGKLVRTVGVRYESGWRFETEGKMQKFECSAMYRAPHVRDRFNGSLLKEYLAAMKLYPFEDKFFLSGRNVIGYRVYAPWFGKSKRVSFKTMRLRDGPFTGFYDEVASAGR